MVMDKSTWIGPLLSIPFGILSGLAVRPVERWLERSGRTRSTKKTELLRKEYERVVFYRQHSDKFTQYLAVTSIRAMLGLGAGGMASFVFFSFLWQFAVPKTWRFYLVIGIRDVSMLAAIVAGIYVFNAAWDALEMWSRVEKFEKYQETVPPEIRAV
jgi:hypothetical protein